MGAGGLAGVSKQDLRFQQRLLEARHLELDVVGMAALQEVGALEAVVENGEATLVVGVA